MQTRRLSFHEACARFPHRYTLDHVPSHAHNKQPNGRYLAPQYASDREWYDHTAFAGESPLADARHCYSAEQSWPLGQWLDVEPTWQNLARLITKRAAQDAQA